MLKTKKGLVKGNITFIVKKTVLFCFMLVHS